jgi:hypothetical protein
VRRIGFPSGVDPVISCSCSREDSGFTITAMISPPVNDFAAVKAV